MIRIRQAVYEDIPRIMKFIDEHWKRGHILARNRAFFEWQYVDNNWVNFYIAIDDETSKIYAMEGFILYNRLERPDMSGTMWKAIRCENPTIGIEVSLQMEHEINARYCHGLGLSKRSERIHKLWGHSVINMDHFYRLNNIDNYKIAMVTNKIIPPAKSDSHTLIRLEDVNEMKEILSEEDLQQKKFYKCYSFIEKRYFKHPIWTYQAWKIQPWKTKARSVIITREQEHEGARILKIIDYFGELNDLQYISYSLDELMKKKHYEYIDLYSYGIPENILIKGGFVRREPDDENIIPNLFYPFVQKNTEIRMIEPVADLILMRGDGDQDRPS